MQDLFRTFSRRQFLKTTAVTAAGMTIPFWAGQASATDGPQVMGSGSVGPDIHGGATPAAVPPGPFQPTWDSLRQNSHTPDWFAQSKFGIFIHWGLYAIPAYHNEWYAKHMYGAFVEWHTQHFGPPDKFGYKNFVPMFQPMQYDPDAWALLFKKAGARYVVPVGEHHDGFAMWDSNLTPWCAGKMGPKRDLIGDLAKAVRKQDLIFGVSSHRMEHHTFMYPTCKQPTDLFDPQNANFYGPPVPGNMNDGNASPQFQADWLARCQELIDKYQPQILWFDNGVNSRNYDDVKLRCAAYYYNRAARWDKPVTISTKGDAYLAGSVLDFEKAVRGPKDILGGAWQIDDQIASNSWGYVDKPAPMNYRSPTAVIGELVDTVSKGGNLLLNISPRADGTIPEEQQQILLHIGQWLGVNGKAIYGSRPWTQFSDGLFRFTTQGDTLYAIALRRPNEQALLPSLASGKPGVGTVARVTLLGMSEPLAFTQDPTGLHIALPANLPGDDAWTFQIQGLKLV